MAKKKDSLKEITTPVMVLDFTEDTGFFIHKVDNGQRAENFARLLRLVFSGNDRPCPMLGGDKGLEAYRAYPDEEKLKKLMPDIKTYEFGDRLIPSLNKKCEALGIVRDHGHLSPDQQDKLFHGMKKFFENITPVIEQEKKVA